MLLIIPSVEGRTSYLTHLCDNSSKQLKQEALSQRAESDEVHDSLLPPSGAHRKSTFPSFPCHKARAGRGHAEMI